MAFPNDPDRFETRTAQFAPTLGGWAPWPARDPLVPLLRATTRAHGSPSIVDLQSATSTQSEETRYPATHNPLTSPLPDAQKRDRRCPPVRTSYGAIFFNDDTFMPDRRRSRSRFRTLSVMQEQKPMTPRRTANAIQGGFKAPALPRKREHRSAAVNGTLAHRRSPARTERDSG
jgi:hypothetical protein